jgi:hypothetical protein
MDEDQDEQSALAQTGESALTEAAWRFGGEATAAR